jgi:hypothetical protein
MAKAAGLKVALKPMIDLWSGGYDSGYWYGCLFVVF